MSKGYEIPISVPGADAALRAFDQIAEKLKSTGRAASDAMRTARTDARVSDPWSRLDRANERVGRLRGMGLSDQDMRASRLEQIRAQRQVDRAQRDLNPQEPDPIRTMFMRTRLKIGPWQPLVGDLVKNGLLDPTKMEGMLSKLSGSGALVSAVKSISAAVMPALLMGSSVASTAAGAYLLLEQGQNKSRSLAGANYAAGGPNPGTTSMAAAVGAMFGMDAATMASKARELGDRLRQGGYGAATMRAAGITDLGIYTQDKMGNMLKVIDKLRSMDRTKAVTVARDLGIEDMLPLTDISDSLYRSLKNSVGNATVAERRRTAEYDANRALISNNLDNIYRSITGPTINAVNQAIDYGRRMPELTNAAGTMAGLSTHSKIPGREGFLMQNLSDALDQFLGPLKPMNDLYVLAKSYFADKPDAKMTPIDENTKALKDATRVMKDGLDMTGGVFGGGRAKGAIPAGWKHAMMEGALVGHAQALGAFTVG